MGEEWGQFDHQGERGPPRTMTQQHAITSETGENMAVVEVDDEAEHVLAPALASLIDLWLALESGHATSFTVHAGGSYTLYGYMPAFIRHGNLNVSAEESTE